MKLILDRHDREAAYKAYAEPYLLADEEAVVTMPTYSDGSVTIEIVKKQTPEPETAPTE